MCQRLNTGVSNNFYFGIFICIGPLRSKCEWRCCICATVILATEPSRHCETLQDLGSSQDDDVVNVSNYVRLIILPGPSGGSRFFFRQG